MKLVCQQKYLYYLKSNQLCVVVGNSRILYIVNKIYWWTHHLETLYYEYTHVFPEQYGLQFLEKVYFIYT